MASFNTLRLNYLMVVLSIMLADGLQGKFFRSPMRDTLPILFLMFVFSLLLDLKEPIYMFCMMVTGFPWHPYTRLVSSRGR